MKKALKIIGLALACIAFPMAAEAQALAKLPSPVIAVVDVQRVLQESLAGKSAQKQLEAQRLQFQNEIAGEENELRKAERELAKLRTTLDAQAYAEREQQLRQRFTAVENHMTARRRVLDKSFSDSMNAVRSALLEVVDQTAREHGANLVIVKQQALWTNQILDVTDEVLNRLDKKMPKVDVAAPPSPSKNAP